ncbi:hypothetical protein K470DRAFT_259335 [Piedraia hortae CBS 480.64]|uniref:Uncharacterized protein n=1 Tax=Piedraia hortae CBS 480.64 TaxID=1314780 RepID=A0A6A7BWS2_9PEZI|nr:hypothetical protein K470DRAFT_259335 [Piedraia hortae CBS 480.64]
MAQNTDIVELLKKELAGMHHALQGEKKQRRGLEESNDELRALEAAAFEKIDTLESTIEEIRRTMEDEVQNAAAGINIEFYAKALQNRGPDGPRQSQSNEQEGSMKELIAGNKALKKQLRNLLQTQSDATPSDEVSKELEHIRTRAEFAESKVEQLEEKLRAREPRLRMTQGTQTGTLEEMFPEMISQKQHEKQVKFLEKKMREAQEAGQAALQKERRKSSRKTRKLEEKNTTGEQKLGSLEVKLGEIVKTAKKLAEVETLLVEALPPHPTSTSVIARPARPATPAMSARPIAPAWPTTTSKFATPARPARLAKPQKVGAWQGLKELWETLPAWVEMIPILLLINFVYYWWSEFRYYYDF